MTQCASNVLRCEDSTARSHSRRTDLSKYRGYMHIADWRTCVLRTINVRSRSAKSGSCFGQSHLLDSQALFPAFQLHLAYVGDCGRASSLSEAERPQADRSPSPDICPNSSGGPYTRTQALATSKAVARCHFQVSHLLNPETGADDLLS
jgi:hypothetical protein